MAKLRNKFVFVRKRKADSERTVARCGCRFQIRPNLEEELSTVFSGFTFSNGHISRSTSLADNLDRRDSSRVRVSEGRTLRQKSVVQIRKCTNQRVRMLSQGPSLELQFHSSEGVYQVVLWRI